MGAEVRRVLRRGRERASVFQPWLDSLKAESLAFLALMSTRIGASSVAKKVA